MQDVEYGKVNMTVRVHENHLLNKSHYDRMLEAPSYEDALRVLLDTKYREDVEQAIDDKEYETMLNKELRRTYQMIIDQVPNPQLSELITLEYAYHNIKVLFKEFITDKDFSSTLIDIGKHPIFEFRKAISTQDSQVLSPAYIASIRELHQNFQETPSINDIDVYVDREYAEHLVYLAEKIDDPAISEYVLDKIDLKNLSIFLRALVSGSSANHIQAVLSDHGSLPVRNYVDLVAGGLDHALTVLGEGPMRDLISKAYDDNHNFSLSRLEKAIDTAEVDYLSQAKMEVFGPLPVLAYVNAIETEVKNIRLILTGKINSIDPNIVRERMRLNYAT